MPRPACGGAAISSWRSSSSRRAGSAWKAAAMSETTASSLEKVRDTVGISLMGSEETTAALELVRAEMPDARIADRGCFYKIEREVLLELDMKKLGELLGRPITVHQ